ncbi:helix-turn-helix domain-containing protein [Loigolactobacillus zhaoyuanensis]|uniref:Multiprotein-bridging factor 1 family protein n=1 Tax=Loigolactobacillus zhaoyuanensis TaxID=2486017 RepID=A0ABW8UE84_9LACO|nr:helix-turn-helix domain-containing protein [Loigolactobacillus zhaoyuanensis]
MAEVSGIEGLSRRQENILELAAQLVKLREQRGISREDLADKTNMTPAMIARVENLEYLPTLKTLSKMAAGLDLKLGWIDSTTGHQSIADVELPTTWKDENLAIDRVELAHAEANLDRLQLSTTDQLRVKTAPVKADVANLVLIQADRQQIIASAIPLLQAELLQRRLARQYHLNMN